MRKRPLFFGAVALALGATPGMAEPIFLAKQYTRCTACHFSPTGGGLLTPYGRALSQELSATGGGRHLGAAGREREPEFLWGLLGDRLGPLSVGIDARPSHLKLDVGEVHLSRDFLMTMDLIAAYPVRGWTLYGEVGRQPHHPATIDSYEYWVGRLREQGVGFRAGRFLPAYGLRLPDHSALTRAGLALDKYDQVFGAEVSYTGGRHLLQISAGPGRASSILEDDGRRAFTATGRWQADLGPRRVLVVSGLLRLGRLRTGAGGVAFGYAPSSRLSIWHEADVQVRDGERGPPSYTVLSETALEVHRGIWLKFSPQLRTEFGDLSGGLFRLAVEVNLLPRTHWQVNLSGYRDRPRGTDRVFRVLLAQLHLYL